MKLWDEILNEMSDDPLAWWPFGFLRPEKHEPMTTKLVLFGAVLYGGFLGMLGNILVALAEAPVAEYPLVLPLALPLLLFAFHRLTFARAWNRRAARLAVLASMETEEDLGS